MRIIIDISKKQYEIIKELVKNQNSVCPEADSAEKIILKGTPLPKGHGRIIDESQVTGTFIWDNGYIECYAPTIIEADKES